MTRILIVAALALAVIAQPAAARGQCNSKRFYEDNPTYADPRDDSADWDVSLPEDQGMSSARLIDGVNRLATNKSLLSVLVIRHGKLVFERYVNGGGVRKSNNVHSASKSMLQALVGIAVQRGQIASIDDRVSKYLPGGGAITLRHLMSMSSGLDWEEDVTECTIEKQPDWVAAILGRRQVNAPGSAFNYSTGNTHVLSAVLQKATGMRTSQFAQQVLFNALGVVPEHWGRDPRGVDSGGYNTYLTPREMAKFGLLYLNDGMWRGVRVVPQATVAQARTKTFQVDADFAYSQGWWMRTISGHDMYFGWGYGGQFLYVIPDLDIVFATTENTAAAWRNVEIDSGAFIRDTLIPSVIGR